MNKTEQAWLAYRVALSAIHAYYAFNIGKTLVIDNHLDNLDMIWWN